MRGAGALKLFIYDSVFMDNHASTSGGAIYTNAAPQITGCVFNSNIANGEAGGAIALDEPVRRHLEFSLPVIVSIFLVVHDSIS